MSVIPTPRPTGRVRTRRSGVPELVGFALAVSALGAVLAGLVLGQRGLDLWGAIILPAFLVFVTAPIVLNRERRREDDLGRLLVLGLVARFTATYLRYLMEVGYDRFGDALAYHTIGAKTADQVW